MKHPDDEQHLSDPGIDGMDDYACDGKLFFSHEAVCDYWFGDEGVAFCAGNAANSQAHAAAAGLDLEELAEELEVDAVAMVSEDGDVGVYVDANGSVYDTDSDYPAAFLAHLTYSYSCNGNTVRLPSDVFVQLSGADEAGLSRDLRNRLCDIKQALALAEPGAPAIYVFTTYEEDEMNEVGEWLQDGDPGKDVCVALYCIESTR